MIDDFNTWMRDLADACGRIRDRVTEDVPTLEKAVEDVSRYHQLYPDLFVENPPNAWYSLASWYVTGIGYLNAVARLHFDGRLEVEVSADDDLAEPFLVLRDGEIDEFIQQTR